MLKSSKNPRSIWGNFTTRCSNRALTLVSILRTGPMPVLRGLASLRWWTRRTDFSHMASQGKLLIVFPMYDKGFLVGEREAYNQALKSPKLAIPGFVEYQGKKADLALIKLGALP